MLQEKNEVMHSFCWLNDFEGNHWVFPGWRPSIFSLGKDLRLDKISFVNWGTFTAALVEWSMCFCWGRCYPQEIPAFFRDIFFPPSSPYQGRMKATRNSSKSPVIGVVLHLFGLQPVQRFALSQINLRVCFFGGRKDFPRWCSNNSAAFLKYLPAWLKSILNGFNDGHPFFCGGKKLAHLRLPPCRPWVTNSKMIHSAINEFGTHLLPRYSKGTSTPIGLVGKSNGHRYRCRPMPIGI